MLIQVLGIDFAQTVSASHRHASWQEAWDEIRRSRGEAIQAGVQENEIIEEELCSILTGILSDIRRTAADSHDFAVSIPASQGVQGSALFNRVCGVEEGFRAPDGELKVVRDLNSIEQWRV